MKVINLETGHEFEWTKETFLNRIYLMKEMYQNYESEETWDVPPVSYISINQFLICYSHPIIFIKEKDPFFEDPDTECLIGCAQVFLQVKKISQMCKFWMIEQITLQPLAYLVEVKEQLSIVDFRGTEVGIINTEIVPCNAQGKEYSEVINGVQIRYFDTNHKFAER